MQLSKFENQLCSLEGNWVGMGGPHESLKVICHSRKSVVNAWNSQSKDTGAGICIDSKEQVGK